MGALRRFGKLRWFVYGLGLIGARCICSFFATPGSNRAPTPTDDISTATSTRAKAVGIPTNTEESPDEQPTKTAQEIALDTSLAKVPGIIYADVRSVDDGIVGVDLTVRPGTDTLTLAKRLMTTTNQTLKITARVFIAEFFTGTHKVVQQIWDGLAWSTNTITLVDSIYDEKVMTATAAAPQNSVAPTKVTPP